MEKLYIAIPEYNQTSVDKVVDWLRRFALTTDSSVSLILSSSSVSCVNPELVSEIKFYEYEDGYLNEAALQTFSSYLFLTKLQLPFLQFAVEQLNAFPHLKLLTVGGFSKSANRRFLPASKIEILVIQAPDAVDCDSLPDVIKFCFPFLIDFTFCGNVQAVKDFEVEFSNLPNSCTFLTTEIEYFRCFTKCEHIRNVSIFMCSFEDLALVKDLSFSSMEVSKLKIDFGHYLLSSSQLLTIIVHMLEKFKTSLTIFSVDNIHLSDVRHDYVEKSVCDLFSDFDNSLRNQKSIDSSISHLQSELKQLCSASKIQSVIFGKTAFVKKSTTSTFIQEMNQLEFKYGWKLRPGPGVILPMDSIFVE